MPLPSFVCPSWVIRRRLEEEASETVMKQGRGKGEGGRGARREGGRRKREGSLGGALLCPSLVSLCPSSLPFLSFSRRGGEGEKGGKREEGRIGRHSLVSPPHGSPGPLLPPRQRRSWARLPPVSPQGQKKSSLFLKGEEVPTGKNVKNVPLNSAHQGIEPGSSRT